MLSTIEVHIQQNHEEAARVYKGLIGVLEIMGIHEPPQPASDVRNTASNRLMEIDANVCLTSDMLDRCQQIISIIHVSLTQDPREPTKQAGTPIGINREPNEYWRNRAGVDEASVAPGRPGGLNY
jgi:hypothetical protein